MVQTYVEEWRKTVTRMGRWVDFDNDYKTMDPDFMETRVVGLQAALGAGTHLQGAPDHALSAASSARRLSNFEANRNYQDVQDPSITCRFRIINQGGSRRKPTSWHGQPHRGRCPQTSPCALDPRSTMFSSNARMKTARYILAESRVPVCLWIPGCRDRRAALQRYRADWSAI
jgi:hypothetical protein